MAWKVTGNTERPRDGSARAGNVVIGFQLATTKAIDYRLRRLAEPPCIPRPEVKPRDTFSWFGGTP